MKKLEKKKQTANKWIMASFNVLDKGVRNEILTDCCTITTLKPPEFVINSFFKLAPV